MNIQVSNLNLNLIESDIRRLFTPYGEISSITIVRDQLNNRSRGRAYVDMPVDKDAQNAIAALDGTVYAGKAITLFEAGSQDEISKRTTNF